MAGRSFAQAPKREEPAARAESAVSKDELADSIRDVLKRREFTWRLPRKLPPTPNARENEGFLARMAKAVRENTRRFARWFEKKLDELARRLSRLFRGTRTERGGNPFLDALFTSHGVLYALLALLLSVGAIFFLRWRRHGPVLTVRAEAVLAEPDLLARDVDAGEREPDDWLRLGAEWLERGDSRRALRALFLACLSRLSAQRLVSLAPYKSNGEYMRELCRRARVAPETVSTFGELVRTFDGVWYGRLDVTGELLEAFRARVAGLLPSPTGGTS